MRLELLFLGKTRESYLAAGIEDYSKRLKHYTQVNIKILKERRRAKDTSAARIMATEGEILLANIPKSSLLVALDSAGRQFSSEELAGTLGLWADQGRKNAVFVIGGPLGLAPAVLKKADLALSLSRMTLTHEMARLVLLEQIYRAYTILAGEQYHK